MKVLRSPLIHFLLFGLLIFAIELWRSLDEEGAANTRSFSIVIDSVKIEELKANFQRQTSRDPGPKDLDFMIANEVDEEILYREALAMGFLEGDGGIQTRLIQKMLFLEEGAQLDEADELLSRAIALDLHRDDIVVRRILVQKMKLYGSTLTPDEKPSLDEISAAYQERRDALREPDRRTLTHVFFSADRRFDRTHDDARNLRAGLLESKALPVDAIALGDPFPLGHELQSRSLLDLD